MKKINLALLLITIVFPGFSQSAGMLKDASWAKERINKGNVVIFHIGMLEDYEKEHIPEAIFIDGDDYTFGDDTFAFDLPPLDKFKIFLESKGVTNETDIVIYTSTTWVPMVTRLYFTFDYLGLGTNTFILDGGLDSWKAYGGEVTDKEHMPTKGNLSFHENRELIVDKAFVKKALDNKNITIVDCRASVYYKGIEMNSRHGGRKGRIPGAKTIPYTSLTSKTSGVVKFKTLEQLASIFEEQGLNRDDEVVLYCHIGMQLTVVYTAAKLLGYQNVKIYDGSFHEWGPDLTLPVELE